MATLHRFLVDYDMAMLRALAEARGVALTTNRQPETVDQLAAALLEPLSVRVALAHLSPQAQMALDALLAEGGQMRSPQFARRFGQVRPIGPGRLERESLWLDPASPAEELWYAAFLFGAISQDEAGPGEFVFVPEDLLPLLPQPDRETQGLAVETQPPPGHEQDGGSNLVQDLFAYLVYVQTHDVRPYADGRLSRRDLDALHKRMSSTLDRRLDLLWHLARRLGFVTQQEKTLRLQPASAKPWLVASPARQLAMLQETWRDDPTWIDLCRVPALACDEQMPWFRQYDPVAVRQTLLGLLARCPVQEWWSVTSLVQAIKDVQPDFQRPDADYASWYIRDAASDNYLSGFESWDQVEGALITDLLTGTLTWLGVVATGPGYPGPDGEQFVVCRLTEAGARFLGLLPDAEEPPPPPPIIVRPDLTVEVPPASSLYTRFQLERFADLQSGTPCRYALTAGALGRAHSRGIQVDQVVAFLRQSSQDHVPANVVGQLRVWADRFGQVQLEEGALLTLKNERVLREISVLPETRDLVGSVLSPTQVWIPKEHLPRLQKALRALGYLAPDN